MKDFIATLAGPQITGKHWSLNNIPLIKNTNTYTKIYPWIVQRPLVPLLLKCFTVKSMYKIWQKSADWIKKYGCSLAGSLSAQLFQIFFKSLWKISLVKSCVMLVELSVLFLAPVGSNSNPFANHAGQI